jgi:hypothetical protein
VAPQSFTCRVFDKLIVRVKKILFRGVFFHTCETSKPHDYGTNIWAKLSRGRERVEIIEAEIGRSGQPREPRERRAQVDTMNGVVSPRPTPDPSSLKRKRDSLEMNDTLMGAVVASDKKSSVVDNNFIADIFDILQR